ncbi:MAG: hypothetical protein Q9209_001561 [Squamulea sp. 1 TL-2023]
MPVNEEISKSDVALPPSSPPPHATIPAPVGQLLGAQDFAAFIRIGQLNRGDTLATAADANLIAHNDRMRWQRTPTATSPAVTSPAAAPTQAINNATIIESDPDDVRAYCPCELMGHACPHRYSGQCGYLRVCASTFGQVPWRSMWWAVRGAASLGDLSFRA